MTNWQKRLVFIINYRRVKTLNMNSPEIWDGQTLTLYFVTEKLLWYLVLQLSNLHLISYLYGNPFPFSLHIVAFTIAYSSDLNSSVVYIHLYFTCGRYLWFSKTNIWRSQTLCFDPEVLPNPDILSKLLLILCCPLTQLVALFFCNSESIFINNFHVNFPIVLKIVAKII